MEFVEFSSWENFKDFLVVGTIVFSIFGIYVAATLDYERWIKPKWLRPVVYIILVPITGWGTIIFLVLLNVFAGVVLLSPFILFEVLFEILK